MQKASAAIKTIATIGYVAKGLVYCLVGILAFMAAFELGKGAGNDVDKQSTFSFIEQLPAGKWLLAVVALGLLCYVLWRIIQAFLPGDGDDSKMKTISKKVRYLFSGLAYLLLALFAVRMVLKNEKGGGSSNQQAIKKVMQMDYGQWMIGLLALVIASVGVYQIYYSFSEKYKKHISVASMDQRTCNLLLSSGKIGYVARGLVWLVIAWLAGKAALACQCIGSRRYSQGIPVCRECFFRLLFISRVGIRFIMLRHIQLHQGPVRNLCIEPPHQSNASPYLCRLQIAQHERRKEPEFFRRDH